MTPWDRCRCGHLMLLHDVEDLDGSNPTCCVEGCEQDGCGWEGWMLTREDLSDQTIRIIADGVTLGLAQKLAAEARDPDRPALDWAQESEGFWMTTIWWDIRYAARRTSAPEQA